MKRIRIWLKSFSLAQQFVTIGFLVLLLFMLFASTILSDNIDEFVDHNMYSYLHEAQDNYINHSNSLPDDANVNYYLYDLALKEFVSNSDSTSENIIKTGIDFEGSRFDGKISSAFNEPIIYSLYKTNNKRYLLISVISNTYRSGFEKALFDGVINLTFMVFVALLGIMAVWVLTLIHPLDQIKHYIDAIRLGENAELNIDRGDEIGELAEALQDMQEEVSSQKRIREEMIQNISHDLKTPIATIKSYSESIKDGVYPYGTLDKSVDVIIEHANRLEKKVYSLLTFNKLGYLNDDAPDGKTLAMIPVIREALISVQVLRGDITIKTDLKDGIAFHGEAEPWVIVVENLLDNSLRYAKSYVSIRLRKDLLEISNDGPLMSQEEIDKLFKPYEKGNGGNFGLGLSIVKRVVETYGYNVIGANTNDGVIFKIYPQKIKRKKHNTV